MNEQDLIRLGMYVNELEHLRQKYGFWLQSAEVYMPSQADPLATITAGGGGEYIVLIQK